MYININLSFLPRKNIHPTLAVTKNILAMACANAPTIIITVSDHLKSLFIIGIPMSIATTWNIDWNVLYLLKVISSHWNSSPRYKYAIGFSSKNRKEESNVFTLFFLLQTEINGNKKFNYQFIKNFIKKIFEKFWIENYEPKLLNIDIEYLK